jgi:ribosome recycling factor
MHEEILTSTNQRMDSTIEDCRQKLGSVRTGRASLALLDRVVVDYYGTPTPLNQVAKLSIPEPAMILAQPFDPSTIAAIERAILMSDTGLNPSNDGKLVRIPVPPLTEERRKLLVRKVGSLAEEAKTAIRQIRRDSNEEFKKLQKDGKVSEDDAHRSTDEIQKITDRHTGSIDDLCKHKEKELMEI